MSVVRIPKPDEDAFPWPRVAAAVVLGGALGLGIAWCGMETDRSTELEDGAEPSAVSSGEAEPRDESDWGDEPPSGETPVSTRGEADPSAVPDASTATSDPDSAVPVDEAVAVQAPEPVVADLAVEPESAPTGRGSVTLRRGRVAYLRCDGVPQREGPFPCPRDEPLEAAVWSAISEVERCARSPGPGQADVVVDLSADGVPTIRARDTFPPDVARTDDDALLACTSESLGNVRSSLSPRRLVVSFRLTLDPSEP